MTCETVIALQTHWNVKGPHFIALYELFDKVAEELGSSPTITGKMGDADTVDLFTEASRGADKPLWLIEAHASENLFLHTMKPLDSP